MNGLFQNLAVIYKTYYCGCGLWFTRAI